MTVTISLTILFSFCMLGVLPFTLIALSHGPLRVAAPGRRFVVTAALIVILWLIGLFALYDGGQRDAFADVIVAVLLMTGGLLAAFTLWTLIAWGFSVSLLLALSQRGGTLDFTSWVHAYTGGQSLERFAKDRQGVLLRFNLAQANETGLRITPWPGRAVAFVAVALRRLFGIRA